MSLLILLDLSAAFSIGHGIFLDYFSEMEIDASSSWKRGSRRYCRGITALGLLVYGVLQGFILSTG